jgi:membrane protein DedA with SNARE-associated domain
LSQFFITRCLPLGTYEQNRSVSSRKKLRSALLWLAAIRAVVGIAAIPLAPFLFREHFIVLVLMRPTKEVLLAAGFLVRAGKVELLPVLLAAVPLMILGVWQFFYLGRAFHAELGKGEIPGFGGRFLKAEKVKKVGEVLDKRGPRLIFLGRLAALSSALIAAAAGACKMAPREFLPVDALGALVSAAIAIGAGYVLGEAYEEASPLLTVVGVATLVAGAVLLARYLKKT